MVLFTVRGWVEPTTCWLVAQFLNQLCYRMPPVISISSLLLLGCMLFGMPKQCACLMPQNFKLKYIPKSSRKFEFVQAATFSTVPDHLCDVKNCQLACMKSVSTKQQITFCPPKCHFGVWQSIGWSSFNCHWHWNCRDNKIWLQGVSCYFAQASILQPKFQITCDTKFLDSLK